MEDKNSFQIVLPGRMKFHRSPFLKLYRPAKAFLLNMVRFFVQPFLFHQFLMWSQLGQFAIF
ncbi:hypothetical protein CLOSTASPAR_03443 [[Clostridium] asparagiforme DSM 15981]|uniref:Uncharacterized protein n=1 Tax=[Clostridium] asparagiforme DSM 15981 TaxID=518636 RepID=C0D2F4_9FIRM|nr:hypothetical protein CLOSTASPAR_03443 [[Clostridium] asparagiforme DSM 15981]